MSLANAWRKNVEDMKDRPFEYTLESLVRPPFSLINVGCIDSVIPHFKG